MTAGGTWQRWRPGFARLGLASLLLSAGPAAAGKLEVSTGFDATTGHYGQPQPTTILTESVETKYIADKWAAWVYLPYLQTIGPGNVIVGVGAIGGPSVAPTVTETGIGDVVLGARHELWSIPATGTIFDIKGKIHFGTAPVSRALGTGLNDYYLELDASQPSGRKVWFYADFGRRFTGSSPDFPLSDVWYGEAAATYDVTPKWTAGLWLDMQQPSFVGDGMQQEVTATIDWRPAPGWKIEVYGVKGFASGSPDYGGGMVVTRIFSF
jgi:hypothetical protein